MILERIFTRPSKHVAPVLLALACLSALGCDRTLVDPALRDGDEAALLRAAGLARPEGRYTLAAMVVEATRTLERADRGEAARELLAALGREQSAGLAAAQAGEAEAAAAARESMRRAQLAIVAEVLGRSGAERAAAGVAEHLDRAAAALDSAAARQREVGALRERHAAIAGAVAAARTRLAEGDAVAALDLATGAAEQLVQLRRGILDLDRVAALPELYARAERQLQAANGEAAGGALLLEQHAALEAAAAEAVAGGDRDRAHAALSAVRESELRITLEALGPSVAAQVVADVGQGLADVAVAAEKAEPRLKRMVRAARDLHYRASTALRTGDGIAALDLASYAAGLVNAFRLATVEY